MTYIILFIGGDSAEITEEEFVKLRGRQGAIYIPSINQVVNLSSVSRIMPKHEYEIDRMREKQKSQKTGVLHDGRRVYKHFGEWAFDEEGTLYIISDWKEYPEVQRNCVPTELEWETKYKLIPDKESRLKAILGHFQNLIEKTGEMKSIKELLNEKYDLQRTK